MIRKSAAVLSIMVLISTVSFAQSAQVPLGRWNKVEVEKPGTGIIVTLKGGEVIEGFLKSLSTDTIAVLRDDLQEQTLPKTAVQKIVTREKRSGPLWNGAVIGAAIPTTLFVIACAASSGTDKGACWAATVIWAGIGAGIGVGIDALCKGQITLYEAPEPRK